MLFSDTSKTPRSAVILLTIAHCYASNSLSGTEQNVSSIANQRMSFVIERQQIYTKQNRHSETCIKQTPLRHLVCIYLTEVSAECRFILQQMWEENLGFKLVSTQQHVFVQNRIHLIQVSLQSNVANQRIAFVIECKQIYTNA